MPIYNKLVRDLIPSIIENQGKCYHSRILDEKEYNEALRMKLREEVAEYEMASKESDAVEELADILELIYELAAVHGASSQDLERICAEKAKKRGGFKGRVFLIDVED